MDPRRLAGRKAKRRGGEFEQYLINIARSQDIKVIRIADGCRRVGAQRLIQVKQPFDFVLVSKGEAVFCDTKTTLDKNFCYSKIDFSQLQHLSDCEDQGCSAGYLVMFQEELQQIVFFHAYQLRNLRPGESLKPADGIDCGSFYTPNLQVLFSRHRDITEPLTLSIAP